MIIDRMLTKFLDPKNDKAFKKIFGSEKNKDILLRFLNDMLQFKERHPIVEINFINTVQDPEVAARRTSIVDVMCKDSCGNCYIVEMQVVKEKSFIKRAQYYAARAYGSQLKVKDKYSDLKEVIFLAIADFIMFPNKTSYKSDHITLDRDSHEHDLKDFSFTFLELEKFNKTSDELNTVIEKWCFFLKHAGEISTEEFIKIIDNDNIIKKAYEELDRFNWNEQELIDYEAAIKKDRDYEATMDQKFDEGLEKGKIDVSKNIAKSMLQKGLDIQLITEITTLSAVEVMGL